MLLADMPLHPRCFVMVARAEESGGSRAWQEGTVGRTRAPTVTRRALTASVRPSSDLRKTSRTRATLTQTDEGKAVSRRAANRWAASSFWSFSSQLVWLCTSTSRVGQVAKLSELP